MLTPSHDLAPVVNIIIATTCEARRALDLQRAITSVSAEQQAGVKVDVILVVNGKRYDPTLFETFKNNPKLQLIYQEIGSLPLALQTGRAHVTAPFFAFLDDDDEYLKDTLQLRLAPLLSDATIDFVASNGLRGNDQNMCLSNATLIEDSPLLALAKQNWLASCGGLYRSSSVSAEDFKNIPSYLEWTYMAYTLAQKYRMVFVNHATFRINESMVSLSHAPAFRYAPLTVLPRLLTLDFPNEVRQSLKSRLGACLHELSDWERLQGNKAKAWKLHLKSLLYPGRMNYLTYTRHLLF